MLGFALDKYCWISARRLPPFHEHRVRAVYSKVELADRVADLEHPAIRTVLAETGIETGVEITHAGDLPARSGIGSSSSFVVGLLLAAETMLGVRRAGPHELAARATRIEREVMHEAGGRQDQLFAACGGISYLRFVEDRVEAGNDFSPGQVRDLLASLVLVYTGGARSSAEVSASLNLASPALARMRDLAREGAAVLRDTGRRVEEIGEMLAEAWELKRGLSPMVPTARAEEMYARARAAGALGGKMLGAGGGGFFLLFVRPAELQRVRAVLSDFVLVPVGVDWAGAMVVADGTDA